MLHESVIVSKLHRSWREKDSLNERQLVQVPSAGIILNVVSLLCYENWYCYSNFLNVVSLSCYMNLSWYPDFIDIGGKAFPHTTRTSLGSKCSYLSECGFAVMLHNSVILFKLHRYWGKDIPSNNEDHFGFQVQVSFWMLSWYYATCIGNCIQT